MFSPQSEFGRCPTAKTTKSKCYVAKFAFFIDSLLCYFRIVLYTHIFVKDFKNYYNYKKAFSCEESTNYKIIKGLSHPKS
jgi:hypothetical protein